MVYLKRLLQTLNKTNTTHLITSLKPYFKTKAPVKGTFEMIIYCFLVACATVTVVICWLLFFIRFKFN